MINLDDILKYRNRYNYFPNYLGIEFTELTEEKAAAKLKIDQNHLNPNDTVHGGVLFSFADSVAGMLACVDGCMSTTVSGNIDFARPALKGETITAEASFVKRGKSISYIKCEIKNPKNETICFTTFTFYNLKKPFDFCHDCDCQKK